MSYGPGTSHPPPEDNFVERKLETDMRDWKKTIVAFANSLLLGETALLVIGMDDSGRALGVRNSDEVQERIGEICEHQCYAQESSIAFPLLQTMRYFICLRVGAARYMR